MQRQINKKNLAVAIKNINVTFLEFLQSFVENHVTKVGSSLDEQDHHIFNWIKKMYNNLQDYYDDNTIMTLSKVLEVTPEFLILNSSQKLINKFNCGYESYLRTRIINYLQSKNDIEDVIKFTTQLSTDLLNNLESRQNASNKSK
jgi:hypothetical protein